MKVLFIGDPHLKISNFAIAREFLVWTTAVIAKFKPDLVVNLGDTFDTHAVVRSELLSEFKKHVLESIPHTTKYIYVLGNHDMYKPNDSKYHALQVFAGIPNMVVIDKIQDFAGITFVPYLPDGSEFPKTTQPICVAHQTFAGCDFGGWKPEGGVDPDTVSADLIISGHIHKRQTFGKVHYPGSPYSQSLKDLGQTKGLTLLDTDTFKINTIPTPFPLWRSLEIEVGDIKTTAKQIAAAVNDKDNWVVVLEGPRKEVSALMASKEWKALCTKSRISTRTKHTDSDRVEKIRIKANTVAGVAEEYIDRVYSGGVDKELIKKTMRQLFDNYDKNSV